MNDRRPFKKTENADEPVIFTPEELNELKVRFEEDAGMDPEERERLREILTANEEYARKNSNGT